MKKMSDIMQRQIVMFDDSEENHPSIHTLPDGTYNAWFYDWVFELEDGRKFKTDFGVKRGKRMTKLETYTVKDGKFKLAE